MGFLSLLIVVPLISSNQEIYGIYAICISLSAFLQYTDIGFMDAGYKYAAESYGVNDQRTETKILGFVYFVSFLFLLIFIFALVFLAFNPNELIQDLKSENFKIARDLLLILAVSSPIIVMQRFAQAVFAIRIQDYIIQRIMVLANIVKILSVFYFFREGQTEIVEYFFFLQLINLLAVILSFVLIKKRYSYDFMLLIRSFKFSKNMYDKMRNLAFTSLFSTACWILFYMLDTIIIGKYFSLNDVAIYSISLYFLTTVNGIVNIIYMPFLFRFNHVKNDISRLQDIFYRLISLSVPLIVISAFSVIFLMKPIILGLVGDNYHASIIVAQVFMTYFIWSSIYTPLVHLAMSKVKVRLLLISSAILPLVFYLVIVVSQNQIGILSFAVGKSIAMFSCLVFFIIYSPRLLSKSIIGFLVMMLPRITISVIILYLLTHFVDSRLIGPPEKNTLFFVKVSALCLISSMTVILLFLLTSKRHREIIKSILANMKSSMAVN